MDIVSESLIDEFLSISPKIINIHGNTDPTYSSSEFCFVLIDFNGELFQTGKCTSKIITMTMKEWIIYTIKNHIHPDYEIRRTNLGFKIDRVDSIDEEIDDDFGANFGGTIEVII